MKKIAWVHRGQTIDAQSYIRNFVAEKRSNADFKVIDIGGGLGNWAKDFSDVCIDMKGGGNQKIITGDLYDSDTWEKLNNQRFDLAILSHILEDVRDPFYIIHKTLEIAKTVYISVPSIFLEFQHIESNKFVGYHHHRWLFACDGNQLYIVPKTSLANAWQRPKKSFIDAFDYLRVMLKIDDNFVHLHTRLGWARTDTASRMLKKVEKHCSLSLLIDHDSKITSYDYIQSGTWLLEKYQELIEIEKKIESE
jgi:hypothetical protein